MRISDVGGIYMIANEARDAYYNEENKQWEEIACARHRNPSDIFLSSSLEFDFKLEEFVGWKSNDVGAEWNSIAVMGAEVVFLGITARYSVQFCEVIWNWKTRRALASQPLVG